ncbi:MAG: HD domain-containing phosphohydrolase [Armatimonadota bacterium]|nr:HD domain-containing phosphohydrolase [Armatimonadota bacterium]MDR7505297.1 HD domain-containing phosphohydrolase [Armatimonadota bacterium]MDR7547656.1 HD domain-containing phosphohydrolase [Armatimonadota bacterium]MDR7553229.1 HD domain-containing phosphohydrolase [Armatimonadota bacterium]MDR7573474.1 HD domain-containing phosphohydrolase [Armatimonadota bacterium]
MSAGVSAVQTASARVFRAIQIVPAAALLLAPVMVLVYLLANPALDRIIEAAVAHFYIVTFVSLIGFAISAVTIVGSSRLREARAFFLNLAFLSISGIFLIHALTTPGVLIGPNPTVGLAARLSLLVGSIAFTLSTVRWSGRISTWLAARWRAIAVALLLGWLLAAGWALFRPAAPPMPAAGGEAAPAGAGHAHIPYGGYGEDGPAGRDEGRASSVSLRGMLPDSSAMMAVAAMALFLFAAWRYRREHQLSAHPAQATLAAGTVLLAEAQLAMWIAPLWRLSWWGYHVLMLAGFLVALAGFGLSYARRRSLPGLVETLFLTDIIDRIESSYSEALFALVAAVEARDRYTKGHSARVSQMAVLIGEEMGLSGAELRSLGRGGLVHDVGKLAVPDAILSKPGRLSPEEYEVVKRHPVNGYDVVKRIASLRDELPIVLYHHEWYDGRGYPQGLAGERIPLAARITAVADVYDALTSERPYRPPLTEEEALAHLRRMAGTQFDPAVVEAFARMEPRWRERRRRQGL